MSESLRERILASAGREAESLKGDGSAAVRASPLPLHQRLRNLGDALLADARSAPASRDTALTLLAADALMTFACEAMAEGDPGRLADAG